MIAAAALCCALAAPARADSATPAAESGPSAGPVATAGYFFKGMMFYDKGRGGPQATAGWRWRLPARFALWTSAGEARSRGALTAGAADGRSYRVTFDERLAYGEAAVLSPWFPFPLGLIVSWHDSTLNAAAVSGPETGRALAGADRGFGWGVSVRLLAEWFPLKRREGKGGTLSVVLGYNGLMDLSPRAVPVRDGGNGASTAFTGWRPLSGECLQAGLTYAF